MLKDAMREAGETWAEEGRNVDEKTLVPEMSAQKIWRIIRKHGGKRKVLRA